MSGNNKGVFTKMMGLMIDPMLWSNLVALETLQDPIDDCED